VGAAVANRESINVGLIGLGVVGGGVAKVLSEKNEFIARQVGAPLVLKRAADLDEAKRHSGLVDPEAFVPDARAVLDDPDIDIVIELTGGEAPAAELIKTAILSGKHVVTANKEVMAKHGPGLLALAEERGVALLYEASVGGGIPLIAPLRRNLQVNRVSAIHAIINGTTNYILTRMEKEGLDFSAALKEAQDLGYAEADPTSDVEGFDAAYKIAILATIAFHTDVGLQHVYREGISRMASQDFSYAKELGYAIKLLAIAKDEEGSIQVRVHPTLVPDDLLLAKVDGVYNAIQVDGDLTGPVIFYGRGAGSLPTSSAIIADTIQAAQSIRLEQSPRPQPRLGQSRQITPMSEIHTRYYMRLTIADSSGVLAQFAKVLGDHSISIASVIQKEADLSAKTAEIVLMTHPAQEAAVQRSLEEMRRLDVVKDVGNVVRVEDAGAR
jgi:homoserine dehydrogenase